MNATHHRSVLLKLALGLLLLASLPLVAPSLYANDASGDHLSSSCSAQCANGSCSAEGSNAQCACVNGDAVCSDGEGGGSEPEESGVECSLVGTLFVFYSDGFHEIYDIYECEEVSAMN